MLLLLLMLLLVLLVLLVKKNVLTVTRLVASHRALRWNVIKLCSTH